MSLAVQVRLEPGISYWGAVACVLSMLEVMALPDSMVDGSSVSRLRGTSDSCYHVQ